MKRVYIWTFALLMLCYILLSFTLPTDPQSLEKYQLTQNGARLLTLTFVAPLVIIYTAAFYGFMRFNDYAEKVRKTKEGPHFQKLAIGLMIFAFSLPIQSIIGSLFNYVKHSNEGLVPIITLFREYILLVFAFAAVFMIAKGAEGLFDTLRKSKKKTIPSNYALIGTIIIASVYSWLVATESSRAIAEPAHYLPVWLIILTLAIPYVFVWCIGIRAAWQLHQYQNGVNGIIYRRAFDYLSKGVGVIIALSIFLQLITTLSEQLNRLSLAPLLLVIYFLVALYAVGYGFVARGAKKLKQIEEV